MAGNHLKDLGEIIEKLDSIGRLIRIASPVDPAHDLAGLAARFEGGPAAVLFEKVKGHKHPVFTGLYWSRELLGELMGQAPGDLPAYVSDCIQNWQRKPKTPKDLTALEMLTRS